MILACNIRCPYEVDEHVAFIYETTAECRGEEFRKAVCIWLSYMQEYIGIFSRQLTLNLAYRLLNCHLTVCLSRVVVRKCNSFML